MEARKPALVNKPKFSRERAFFDSRCNTQVSIMYQDGDHEVGKLLWVDRYTLCIQHVESGQEKLIYKHAIKALG